MAKIFNLRNDGTYGTMYTIVPETTQDFANRMTCFKVPGMEGGEVMPQTILPNASLYTVSRGIHHYLESNYFPQTRQILPLDFTLPDGNHT